MPGARMDNSGDDRKVCGGEPAAAATAVDQCSPASITESKKNLLSSEGVSPAAPANMVATLSLPCVLIIGNAHARALGL